MAGRPMKDYTRLPDELLEDEAEAVALMARAFCWSAAIPAKVKKPKTRYRQEAQLSVRPLGRVLHIVPFLFTLRNGSRTGVVGTLFQIGAIRAAIQDHLFSRLPNVRNSAIGADSPLSGKPFPPIRALSSDE
jgi:hypothetical protein